MRTSTVLLGPFVITWSAIVPHVFRGSDPVVEK